MAGRLAGKRILVVEDDYFIATDIKRALEGEDATVIGPVGQLAQSLSLADAEPVDAAVLDVNLNGPTSYPLADRLSERGVPCMFVTGYDSWTLPAGYRDAPCLTKPFSTRAILDTMLDLVGSDKAP